MSDPRDRVQEHLLILRCQAGDGAALAALVARYAPGLRLFLRKVAGTAATADDLLQDVWVDVYRQVNRLREPGAFAAWVYRIARDRAYRELRRRRRSSRHAFVDQALADETPVPAGDDGFDREDSDAVRAALDRIAPEHREVLLLRFVEDMTYEQIAHVIGRPVGTVRSRVHYAKLALRAQLTHGKDTSS